ncbi:hypothetical protein N8010_00045 [Crocinitomicaceae bacterium]|jgi:hypothetical protein|nr:hypothetical protein [Crocinitomicaceae bacterium]|tara:strand:- start:320 stop:478 length:159 start_codon:yes stop_codon:yes gene_type:complete
MLDRASLAKAINRKDVNNTIPTPYENHGSLELNSLGTDKDIEEKRRFVNTAI